jgi:Sporulation inhibitor A
VEHFMHKLSIEQLIGIYNEAINSNVCKDFLILLTEEINKRLINDSFIKIKLQATAKG